MWPWFWAIFLINFRPSFSLSWHQVNAWKYSASCLIFSSKNDSSNKSWKFIAARWCSSVLRLQEAKWKSAFAFSIELRLLFLKHLLNTSPAEIHSSLLYRFNPNERKFDFTLIIAGEFSLAHMGTSWELGLSIHVIACPYREPANNKDRAIDNNAELLLRNVFMVSVFVWG